MGRTFASPTKGNPKEGDIFASHTTHHKYAVKSTLLRYEMCVDILGGNLVWIQGPYPAGKFTDINIFSKV
jgi:hypothetical protein